MATANQDDAANLERKYVDNEILMSCVHKYPAVYDKSCRDYKIPLKKKNAWKAIGLELSIDWAEAQTRYNSIRTNFSKYIKRQRSIRSGSGIGDVPEIKPENGHLRWLLNTYSTEESTPIFKRKRTTKCFRQEKSQEMMVMWREKQFNLDEGPDILHTLRLPPKKAYSQSQAKRSLDPNHSNEGQSVKEERKKKTRKGAWSKDAKPVSAIEIDRELVKTMSSLKKAIDDEPTRQSKPVANDDGSDDDYHFCLSLVGLLKHLEPHHKVMAKFQIMKIFNDIESAKIREKCQETQQQFGYPAQSYSDANMNPYRQHAYNPYMNFQSQPMQQSTGTSEQQPGYQAEMHQTDLTSL
eukprot:Seg128.12 transcript_id=Seg128.12/GoldUCD/mRNA.D3Y31 product="hypothetical protein" protein_id=Seg128.12/GoldUCD/D3Y31